MKTRHKIWFPWALLVPGALLMACGSDPPNVGPVDTGAETAVDVAEDDVPPTSDVASDTPVDKTPPPDVVQEDVPPPKDVPAPEDIVVVDAPPPEDLGPADVPVEDIPVVDVPVVDVPVVDVPVVDVPVVDVPVVDVPAVDVPVRDVPPIDVPIVDVPALDVRPIDVPRIDVPVTDVRPDMPSIDLPTADVRPDVPVDVRPDVPTDVRPDVPTDGPTTGCGLTTQRVLNLPTDRVMANVTGASRIPTTSCAATGGPEHIYILRVTARTGIVLSTAGSAFDTVLSVRRACANQATEVACNDDVPGDTVSVIRRVFDPGEYFVIVDQFGMTGTGGAYQLAVSSYTPAANAECATAATLTPGTAATGNTTTGGAASTACLNTQWGPQLYYNLRIPAGQRATVTATPMGGAAWTAVVRELATCAATTCTGSSTSSAPGMPASLVIDNRGTTPRDLVISVASGTGTTGGAFSLGASLGMLPAVAYIQSSTPRACDDMTGGTAIPGVAADDSTSATIDLPFPVTFFRTRSTAYSVSSNGLLQIWPMRTGAAPSTAFENAAIPTAAAPGSFIAAFWDDFNPSIAAAMATTRTRTIGTTPNRRFVVQWANYPFFGDAMSRVTFQAKVFETTNVIELHYCTLTAGASAARVGGDSATVGVENATGTDGVQHSFNRAMAVNTTTAIRYTPVP